VRDRLLGAQKTPHGTPLQYFCTPPLQQQAGLSSTITRSDDSDRKGIVKGPEKTVGMRVENMGLQTAVIGLVVEFERGLE
jgi:hypothetical protein